MPPRSIKRKMTQVAVENKGESSTITDSQTSMPNFSYDIWFEILSWLPATLLYYIMSGVCKTWATMIRQPHFVQTNLHRSKSGTVNFLDNRGYLYSVELNSRYLEARCLKINIQLLMHSTSQGLCIFYEHSTRTYSVINPVTMQRTIISVIDCITSHTDYSYSAVCDRQSKEVKLVLASVSADRYQISSWHVQILGTENSWKKISAGHRFGQLYFPGISIAGFLIYVLLKDIVVLDVSVETVHRICCPTKAWPVTYLQMGKNALSCISHDSGRIFIHVLKEFVAGNWSLYKILDNLYIRGVSPKFHKFIGWIGDELLLRCKPSFVNQSLSDEKEHYTYNLKTKKIISLRGTGPSIYFAEAHEVWVHTPSLLSWKTRQA
ncbi:hypothetical protein POM88_054500 [Heracleum sosnowskyi]|uniref:F-box associated beta-propeller type 3 domain-containing protein n=1 Tax=Heracleum sosnowskyi TaxID=360622 RepID=A0AAD8GNL6_9APIA|nr:hypothetical protein POM88_054500 [Heracleum sosnowskyi]